MSLYSKSQFHKILENAKLTSVLDECTVDGKTTAVPHAVVGCISWKHENGCQVTWLHWRKHKNGNSNGDITMRVVRYWLDGPEITSLVMNLEKDVVWVSNKTYNRIICFVAFNQRVRISASATETGDVGDLEITDRKRLLWNNTNRVTRTEQTQKRYPTAYCKQGARYVLKRLSNVCSRII